MLRINDSQGNDASNLFFIESPELAGLTSISGDGMLPEGASGSASWRIIPSDFAAPSQDTPYFVTGEFQYGVNGSLITVPLAPAQITVMPNASLDLKYFLERDVFSDDPFTEEIEPATFYNLGLLMTNNGAGEARDVRIQAAEPRIVDNERGLVIDFDLVGTQVGAEEPSPSLNIELGDLAPNGGRQVARWLFTSTLQGEFTSFDADFVSLNGFNTPEFSLIDSLSTFFMTHPVQAGAYAGTSTGDDDELFDFLTDEQPDLENLPDKLHQSNGAVDSVTPFAEVQATLLPDGMSAEIDVSMGTGWTYIRVDDPFESTLPLQSVERADGRVLLQGFNAWQTNRIRRDGPDAGEAERYIHIFDKGGSGDYTLRFSTDNDPPSVTEWASLGHHGMLGEAVIVIEASGVTSEPRVSGISRLRVTFDEPIEPMFFQPINIVARGLNVAGDELDLSSISVTTELDASGTVGYVSFTPALPVNAKYCLTLTDVRDVAGNVLVENAQVIVTSVPGDISGDGRVNGADVGYAREIRDSVNSGLIDITDPVQVRGDVTGDGRVNAADVSFARAANGTDTRTIADPCFLPDGLNPTRSGSVGILATNTGTSLDGGDHESGKNDEPHANDEAKESDSWDPIDAAFALEGVTVRVDQSRVVVGPTPSSVSIKALLEAMGGDPGKVQPLGHEDWTVVETGSPEATERLQAALASLGIYSSKMLRDEVGEYLVPMPEFLVAFDSAIPAEWQQRVVQSVDVLGSGQPIIENDSTRVWQVAGEWLRGDEVLATANSLIDRKDVAAAEPNFIVFGSRGTAQTEIATEVEQLAVAEPDEAQPSQLDYADVVIIDDGLPLADAAGPGLTVYGTHHHGMPESSSDFYASVLYTGLLEGIGDTRGGALPTVVSIRALASLGTEGRAVATTECLAAALDQASAFNPSTVISSVRWGYRSAIADLIEMRLQREGALTIRVARAGDQGERRPMSLEAPVEALLALASSDVDKASHSPVNVARGLGLLGAAMARGVDLGVEQAAAAASRVLDGDMPGGMKSFTDTLEVEVASAALDVNGDGFVDHLDVAGLIRRYGQSDHDLDWDGDGVVGGADLIEFIGRYHDYMGK